MGSSYWTAPLRQTDFASLGVQECSDFNGMLRNMGPKGFALGPPPPASIAWLNQPDVLKAPKAISWPFALVALCEAQTCANKTSTTSMVRLAKKVGQWRVVHVDV